MDMGAMAMKGVLQHYRLFSVISRTRVCVCVWGVLPLCRETARCILQPLPTGQNEIRLHLFKSNYTFVVSEFEPLPRYYVHFWINTLGKDIEHPFNLSYELNGATNLLLQR